MPFSSARTGSTVALLPIMAVVFVDYLVIGLAMPVLPLHVHQDLGLSTFVVGVVSGSQFLASLVSRLWAGHQADRKGAPSSQASSPRPLPGCSISCRFVSPRSLRCQSRYCCWAARCSAARKASSSAAR
jgi:MFS family permease